MGFDWKVTMNWLKAIGSFFARLFTPETAVAIQRGIEACAPYVESALQVASIITYLTPTRTDDEILKAIKHYAVPVVWGGAGDRSAVLREIAVAALQKKFPTASGSDLNRALELAVGAIKAK